MLFNGAFKNKIDKSLRRIIEKATNSIANSTAKRKFTEPQYVEPIITQLPHSLENIFKRAFLYRKERFSFRGVFVHQSPEVEYVYQNKCISKKYKCEAGDLLIFLSDKSVLGKITYRAILLQAKKIQPNVMSYPKRIKKKDDAYAQYRLYLKWPKFSFKCRQSDSTPSGIKTYDLSPKSPHKGAQYLFINEKLNSKEADGQTFVSESNPRMKSRSKHFASVICDLIDGVDGCQVQPYCHALPNSWSAFVWDMVSHVYFGKKANCYKKGSRRISHYDIKDKFLHMMFGPPIDDGCSLCNLITFLKDGDCYTDKCNESDNLELDEGKGFGVLMISRSVKEFEDGREEYPRG